MQEDRQGADMRTVVDAAVLPADDDMLDLLRIEGPTVRLSPSAALSLALLLHELATTATKYGSLSVQGSTPLVI